MKPREQALGTIVKPHKMRISGAVAGIACGLIIVMRDPGHITQTDVIGIVAAILVLFSKPSNRSFWFFAGILVGVLLIQTLPQLHSLFAR
jgi:hypothetical protein